MSVYDRRYNVHANLVSHYTDDPAEALAFYRRGSSSDRYPPWITEGYADAEDIYAGHPRFRGIEGTEYRRRTTGKVLPSTLEFLIERKAVQDLLERIK